MPNKPLQLRRETRAPERRPLSFRMMSHEDREYVSSVTLLVLGEDLNPDKVSAELHLEPDSKSNVSP